MYRRFGRILVSWSVSAVGRIADPSGGRSGGVPDVGINVRPCWNFSAKRALHPYLFVGRGLVYTDADIQGLGARLNANYQVGGGLRYRISGERYLLLEYRLHHLSNGDQEHPNCPINSSKILIEVTF